MGSFVRKTALITVALLMLAALGLLAYLNSSRFEKRLETLIVEALESRFPVRVELGRAQLSLFSGGFFLEKLHIFDAGSPEELPAIEVGTARLSYSLSGFFMPSVSLDGLALKALHVRIIKQSNNRLNLANMFLPEGRQPRSDGPKRGVSPFLRLGIRDLSIQESLILYQSEPFLLESAAGQMRVEMDFYPDRQAYHGVAELRDFSLNVGAFSMPEFATMINFRLYGNSVEFPYISIETPSVRGRVNGFIEDLSDFVYRFNTDLQVDVTKISQPNLSEIISRGDFRTVGTFAGRKGDFLYDGRLLASSWAIGRWEFGEFEAQILVDRESVAAESLSTRFLGGVIESQGELSWSADRVSRFRVKAGNVDLSRLLAPFRLRTFDISGKTDYLGSMAWKGVQWNDFQGSGVVSYQGRLGLPVIHEEAVFPMRGTAEVSLDRSGANFEDGVVETMQGRLGYGGEFRFDGRYRFDLAMAADRYEDFVRLAKLADLAGLETWDRTQFDRLIANAEISGGSDDFRLQGEMGLSGLKAGEDSFGDLTSSLLLAPGEFTLKDVRLQRSDQLLTAAFQWSRASGDEETSSSLEVSVENAVAQSLLHLLDLDLPVKGLATGAAQLSRRGSEAFHGEGQFRLGFAEIAGQPVDRLNSSFELGEGRVSFPRFQGSIGRGDVSGSGWFDWDAGEFRVDMEGRALPVSEVTWFPQASQFEGLADVQIQASGPTEAPLFDAVVSSDRLQFWEQSFEKLRLTAGNQRASLETVTFRLETEHGGQPFQVDGSVELVSPYPFRALADLDRLPLEPYLSRLAGEEALDMQGSATGRVEIQGAASTPETVSVSLAVSSLSLGASGYEVHNQSPVRLDWADKVLQIRPVTLVGTGTQLELEGHVRTGDRTLRLDVKGEINLAILSPFLKTGTTGGQVSLGILITGPLDKPRLLGRADVKEAFLRHPEVPVNVSDANGELRFTTDQISIDRLTARTPLGEIGAEGGIFLEGLKPVRWLVNVFGSGLRLEYPRQVFSVIDVDVDVIRSQSSRLISGVVYVRSSEYKEDLSLPELILRYSTSQGAAPAITAEQTTVDIEVEGYHAFRVDNNLADLTASGDLRIRGTLQSPVILGSANIESGQLYLENNEYDIERGTITFNDPRRTRPILNFEASTEIRDVSINVLLRGPLDQLKFSFRSDPPLPAGSIISLLALGRTQEELLGVRGQGQDQAGSLALYGAGAILSRSLGSRLQQQGGRLFGLERISIDPFLMGSERNPAAQVTLGKQLMHNVAVTYSTVLGSNEQGYLVVVQVKLTDWLTVVGSGDQAGAVALDFKLRKRF